MKLRQLRHSVVRLDRVVRGQVKLFARRGRRCQVRVKTRIAVTRPGGWGARKAGGDTQPVAPTRPETEHLRIVGGQVQWRKKGSTGGSRP